MSFMVTLCIRPGERVLSCVGTSLHAQFLCSQRTGVNHLLEYVTKGHEARQDDDALLGLALRSIYNILEHGLLPPSMLESHPHLTEKVRGGEPRAWPNRGERCWT